MARLVPAPCRVPCLERYTCGRIRDRVLNTIKRVPLCQQVYYLLQNSSNDERAAQVCTGAIAAVYHCTYGEGGKGFKARVYGIQTGTDTAVRTAGVACTWCSRFGLRLAGKAALLQVPKQSISAATLVRYTAVTGARLGHEA